jgi:hypothetical protein
MNRENQLIGYISLPYAGSMSFVNTVKLCGLFLEVA